MEYLNHVIYINLDSRQDRRNEIEKELNKLNLYSISERFSAISTPHSGIIGCGYSHLGALKLAKERRYKNVLILEDDFESLVSRDYFDAALKTLFRDIHINNNNKLSFFPKIDVCMLSHIIQKCEPIKDISYICKVINGQTASGYIVFEHYYQTLIDLYSWAIPMLEQTNEHWLYANDHVWKQLQPKDNWVYFTKRLGKQRDGYSDNKMCFMLGESE